MLESDIFKKIHWDPDQVAYREAVLKPSGYDEYWANAYLFLTDDNYRLADADKRKADIKNIIKNDYKKLWGFKAAQVLSRNTGWALRSSLVFENSFGNSDTCELYIFQEALVTREFGEYRLPHTDKSMKTLLEHEKIHAVDFKNGIQYKKHRIDYDNFVMHNPYIVSYINEFRGCMAEVLYSRTDGTEFRESNLEHLFSSASYASIFKDIAGFIKKKKLNKYDRSAISSQLEEMKKAPELFQFVGLEEVYNDLLTSAS